MYFGACLFLVPLCKVLIRGSINSATPISLLERLRSPDDSAAWEEFAKRYARVIRQWCWKWGLQEADAEDLIQEISLIVMMQVAEFQHRGLGSFRAWMKTIAWRCWRRAETKSRRQSQITLADSTPAWTSPDACDNLLAEFDSLAHQELFLASLEAVRKRVEPSTWQAFSMTALSEIPAGEVAEQLGMKVGAVYMARGRVQRYIGDELKRLDPDL